MTHINEIFGSKHAKGWKGSKRWRTKRHRNALQRREKRVIARSRRVPVVAAREPHIIGTEIANDVNDTTHCLH